MDVGTNNPKSRKLPLKKLPRVPGRVTAEQRYWKTFKFPVVTKYNASINSIDFSETEPHEFAITSGVTVFLYDPFTNQVKRSLTQFKQNVRCATFRPDGRLLVSGGDDRRVRVFNVANKGLLKQLKGHTGPVQDACFVSNDPSKLLSVSEDQTVRYWDLTADQAIHTFEGHTDYVRCIRVNAGSSDVVGTAGYDHFIKLWDVRMRECISTFDHGHPVESLIFYPSGTSLASAGANTIKLWDIMSGKVFQELTNHQKTITTLRLNGTASRLFSGSLDQHVKIYDLETFRVVHSIKYAAPILDLGISKNNSHLAVGMSDGTFSVRKRAIQESTEDEAIADDSVFPSAKPRTLASSETHFPEEFKVSGPPRVKLNIYEKHLRKFLYKEALDAVLKTKDPVVIASLLEELVHRKAVHIAVGNRTHHELAPTLKFLEKYILNPRFNSHLFIIFDQILDLYAEALGQSPAIDELLQKIHNKIRVEVNSQKQMFQLLGALEMMMSAKALH